MIIQVLYFKRTGKRVFLMAPIHHHFEKRAGPKPDRDPVLDHLADPGADRSRDFESPVMKRALVTGGNRGIGKAISAGLVAEGLEVVIGARDAAAGAEAAAELGCGSVELT